MAGRCDVTVSWRSSSSSSQQWAVTTLLAARQAVHLSRGTETPTPRLTTLIGDQIKVVYSKTPPKPSLCPLFSPRDAVRRVRYCYGKSSVNLSVRPSVSLSYCDHIGWNTSKLISRLIGLERSLCADPDNHGSTPKGTPGHPNFSRHGLVGYRNIAS